MMPARLRKLPGRLWLGSERGITLVEMLIVMTLLLIVLTPLVSGFVSAMRQEVDQVRREQAYANARLALERMRLDLHCGSGAAITQNPYGGFTLTISEGNDTNAGWCPGVIPAGTGSTGVQWCTIPEGGSPAQFRLYRFLGLNPTDCDGGTGSTFQVDYIAAQPGGWVTNSTITPAPLSWEGSIWPDAPACLAGELPTVAVDFNVALDPVHYPNERYQLRDGIALRNAYQCT